MEYIIYNRKLNRIFVLSITDRATWSGEMHWFSQIWKFNKTQYLTIISADPNYVFIGEV